MQDKIINNTYRLGWRLADKNMSMSRPVYMHASKATPDLAANHHPGNGLDHLRIVECPDTHIIFPSPCSSQYALWCVIQHVNYTQVQYTTELRQNLPIFTFNLFIYITDVDGCGSLASTTDSGCCCCLIHFLIRNW